MLAPDIAMAIVDTNLAFKNKIRQHFQMEEKRILEESNRIFELGGHAAGDRQLDQDLVAFRQSFEEFERKQKSDNLKIEDISYLRRQVETILPRLAPPPPPSAAEAEGGPTPAPGTDSSAGEPLLAENLAEIIDGLEGIDNHTPPKAAALAREIYHLRLEPREVVAFRRLYVAAEGDAELERFLLEAAALRLRINQEAAEITELLDETSVTRDSPVFIRARQTTRLGDGFVTRFGHYIDLAIQDSNFGEAQQLQLLRMRLIRDYSGLWLLVNRPSSS
jgi:hypothetical protein